MDLLLFKCSTFVWFTCRSACFFTQRGRNRPCQCVKEESSHLKPLWVCGVNIWDYKSLIKVRMTNIALIFFETVSEFYFENGNDLIDKFYSLSYTRVILQPLRFYNFLFQKFWRLRFSFSGKPEKIHNEFSNALKCVNSKVRNLKPGIVVWPTK